MSDAAYHELFPLGADDAPYRKLTGDYVSHGAFEGRRIVKVADEALTLLARQAFIDSAHLLRPGHLAQLRAILDDPETPRPFTMRARVKARAHVAYATGLSRQAVDLLFHGSGASAIQSHVPIQRFQRDIGGQ